jgi:hypothetical protein
MSRIPQSKGQKGSLKWIQLLVNQAPHILNAQVKHNLGLPEDEEIAWCSPKAEDDYAEYRDQAFIDLLGIDLVNVPLKDFWPSGGPQWDGLAKSSEGNIFLVEAKAHISEINSPGSKAKEKSLHRIQARLEETKAYLGGTTEIDWSASFYQYTNRLAHLYLLRVLNNLPAYLVFVYFVNDREMDGPRSKAEWEGAIKLLHRYLGINRHRLSSYVLELFIDVDFASESGI